MSLINNMLAGLEDRQAYMSEGRDLVLEGLTSVNDDNFHNTRRKKFTAYRLIILILSTGLLLSFYIYNKYFDKDSHEVVVVAAGSIAGKQPAGRLQNDIQRAATTGKQVVKSEQSVPEQTPAVNRIALKMDYDITAAGIAKPVSEIQPVEAEVNTTPVPETPPDEVAEKTEDGAKTVTANEPSITAFAVGSGNGLDSVVNLDLNQITNFRVYELNKPYRVAVEFDKFLSLPDGIPRGYEHGLVSKIRGHHIYNNKRTMIVLDLNEKGIVNNPEMKETSEGYQLVVHISPANTDEVKRQNDNNMDAVIPQATEVKEADSPKSGKLSVTKNNSTPGQKLARGLNDYRKGKIKEGLDEISQVLEDDPKHIKARSTLVNLLIERSNIPLAINILDDGIALYPERYDWRELKAKLLVKLNKNDEAIKVLSKAGPELGSNPEYYAFLAALLQQRGRNEEAVGYYQRIVAARGDNGIWWMGLGISLERIGQSVQAEDAYSKAVRDNSLAPDIRNYITNRISVLSGQ